MTQAENTEEFVAQLTANQNRLFGYIFSLLGDQTRAADVLQETNLVLWRKMSEFHPDKPFLPWAFAFARFQVMAHLRDRSRDRMLLDEGLVAKMAGEVAEASAELDDVRGALRKCIEGLATQHQKMVRLRYFEQRSVADVASAMDRTATAIKVAMLRVRKKLSDCIEQKLAGEGNS